MGLFQPLQKGEIIDLIAPGYALDPQVLDLALGCVRDWGFVPRVHEKVLSPEYFHSSSDASRFLQLKNALTRKDSRVIWCLRGGYGSNRLIPELLKLKRPSTQKMLIGISDITSLHLFLNQVWKWPSLHAALVDRIAKGNLPSECLLETLQVLSGQATTVVHGNLLPLNAKAIQISKAKLGVTASVLGGNLTTLQSAIGTKIHPKMRNRFLFLEDTGERGYRIDRMLEHLVQAKVLEGCAGIFFGQFIGGNEPGSEQSRYSEAIERFAGLYPKLPMWSGVESGHDVQLRPVPFGTKAIMQGTALSISTGIAAQKPTSLLEKNRDHSKREISL